MMAERMSLLLLVLTVILYSLLGSEAQTEGQVRLTGMNLTVKSSGRLEVFLNGKWGTVSRKLPGTTVDLYLAYGKTVCYQIGHYSGDDTKVATGTVAELNHYLKEAKKPYYINTTNSVNASLYDLQCENHVGKYPRHVLRCSYVPANDSRNHDNDLAVICPTHGSNSDHPFIGQLRIASGSIATINEGTLEIYSGTKWGSICYEGFDQSAANTACRQLGYTNAKSFSVSTSALSEPTVWLDSVSCGNNNENQCLWHCLSKNDYKDLYDNKTKSCDGSAHVGIICVFEVAKSNTKSPFIGNACQVPPYKGGGGNPVTGAYTGTDDNSGTEKLIFGLIIGSVVFGLLVCCLIAVGVVLCLCCLVPSCYLHQQRNKTKYTRYNTIQKSNTDDV